MITMSKTQKTSRNLEFRFGFEAQMQQANDAAFTRWYDARCLLNRVRAPVGKAAEAVVAEQVTFVPLRYAA